MKGIRRYASSLLIIAATFSLVVACIPDRDDSQGESPACSSDSGCNSDQVCQDGTCVEDCVGEACDIRCVDDADCTGDDFVCDEQQGTCVPAPDSPCSFDADCATGEVCLQPPAANSRCVSSCDNDPSVCGDGERCTFRYDSANFQRVCFPDDIPCTDSDDCPIEIVCNTDSGLCDLDPEFPDCTDDVHCSGDRVCRDEVCVEVCRRDSDCPDNEVCNTDTGDCEATTPRAYFIVEITDVTDPATGACESGLENDPGADLMSAEVLIDGLDPGIWARAVNWATAAPTDNTGMNEYSTPPPHLIQGVAPSYDISAGRCPANYDDSTILSLGCGGKVWVTFVVSGEDNIEIPADGTADMYVYEHGAPLCGTNRDDHFKVELCEKSFEDIASAVEPSDVDCTGPELISATGGEGVALDIVVAQ
jgi:hypothetical protein